MMNLKIHIHPSSPLWISPTWVAWLLLSVIGFAYQAKPAAVVQPPTPIFYHDRTPAFERGYLNLFNLFNLPYLTVKNPADLYCREMGYDYQIITHPDGSQDSLCLLPDNTSCPAWDYLNGKCGQEYNVCSKNGLQTVTLTDGKNPFSQEYAVCVDRNGRLEKTVIELTDLVEKVSGQRTSDWMSQLVASAKPALLNLYQTSSLPVSFDWRSFNGSDWTTPVKNQGICGSCWAFSAVGAAEAVTNIAANDPNLDLNLSEQYLVTNCSSAGNCAGGYHASALQFIRDSGIPDEGCLLYVDGGSGGCSYTGSGCNTEICTYATAGECSDVRCSDRCADWANRLTKIKSYSSLAYNAPIDTIKQALIDHGPLSVAMKITGGSFNENNIYTCPDNSSIDHGVVIVGYNDSGSYWIVKNSWGSGWGSDHNGYFKVAYDNCAIQKYVNYADGIMPGNPIPTLTNLNPAATAAGGTSFTLTVYGTDFINGVSTLRWNGFDRSTTYISNNELHATILAADIATAGTASVTVFNSSPGGGTSNAKSFTIFGPAPLPFSDGFETGDPSPAWEMVSTNQGRILTSSSEPHQGLYSLLLDDGSDDDTYSTASAILHLDLSGQSNASLSFWWREFDDENHAQDGVFVRSSAAQSWCQAMSFNNGPLNFIQTVLDLQKIAEICGITFSPDFQVKFQFYDNWSAPVDGYAIDDVSVVDQPAAAESSVFLPFLIDTAPSQAGLINGGFESGPAAGWLESSALGLELIQHDSNLSRQSFQGEWAASLGDIASQVLVTASLDQNGETASLSQQVWVSDSNLYLVFWYWITSEDECGSDQARVTINSSEIAHFDLCVTNQTDGWQAFATSLNSYVGQTISLAFQVETDTEDLSQFLLDGVTFSYPSAPFTK